MNPRVPRIATDLLLESMFQRGDGYLSSFMFGRPGDPRGLYSSGTEVYYRRPELVRAILFVRREGPAYLRYLSVSDIWSMLVDFVSKNYWYLAEDAFLQRFDCSYGEHVSESAKINLSNALAHSSILTPVNEVTLFPLVPIRVEAAFNSSLFFVADSQKLDGNLSPPRIPASEFQPTSFPPLTRWEGRRYNPRSWLGVRSASYLASEKMKGAILGAVALAPLPRYRYMFSGREMFGGRCTLDSGRTTSFGEPHTPALMEDVVINSEDHGWLSLLSQKLEAAERSIRMQVRALEYFYRAWFLPPSERFPWLCMTLDALFGDANHATQAVIDGVRGVLGSEIPDARLRLLMELRASVIHGGAPDVYDSRKYARYYDRYDADPIRDLELVVAKCLRLLIFDGALRVQPDPHAEVIARARAKGRFPSISDSHSIIPEEE